MKFVKRYSVITLGCVSFAAGFSLFIEPASLAPGGISGIVVILSHFYPTIESGAVFLILNLPLLLTGGIVFGLDFLFQTVYGTLVSSVFISIFDALVPSPVSNDIFCLALAGALLSGVGLGLVFRAGGTTGGTDIVARLIQKRHQHVRIGHIFIIVDSAIVLLSGILFADFNVVIYSAFTVTASSLIFNYVLYGGFRAHLLIIIADDIERLAEGLYEIAGVTLLEGVGAYSRARKYVLICAAPKRCFASIAALIKATAPSAIVIKAPADGFFKGYSV